MGICHRSFPSAIAVVVVTFPTLAIADVSVLNARYPFLKRFVSNFWFLFFEHFWKSLNSRFWVFYGPLLVTIVLVAKNGVDRPILALRTRKKGINIGIYWTQYIPVLKRLTVSLLTLFETLFDYPYWALSLSKMLFTRQLLTSCYCLLHVVVMWIVLCSYLNTLLISLSLFLLALNGDTATTATGAARDMNPHEKT